jgi:hypothetical protein
MAAVSRKKQGKKKVPGTGNDTKLERQKAHGFLAKNV